MSRLLKKMVWSSLGILVFFSGILFYRKYLATIDEGYRAGLLKSISYKGSVIKTYEGEMIINSLMENPKIENPSEIFCFSVSSKSMADQLGTIQGQMVIVHYRKRNGAIFWRGDSPYLVDGVKR
jgi:hypothetical protein